MKNVRILIITGIIGLVSTSILFAQPIMPPPPEQGGIFIFLIPLIAMILGILAIINRKK